MKHSLFFLIALTASLVAADRPDILFIAIDDMRDWTGYSGSTQAKAPNMDRLAKPGVSFTRAYTAYALCNPSRTALLTELRPTTTGVISNNNDWREAVPPDRPTLPSYLKSHGYITLGQGKIFHGGKLRREDWDDYAKDREEREENEKDRKDLSLKEGKTPGSFIIGSNLIVPLDTPEEETTDYKTTISKWLPTTTATGKRKKKKDKKAE